MCFVLIYVNENLSFSFLFSFTKISLVVAHSWYTPCRALKKAVKACIRMNSQIAIIFLQNEIKLQILNSTAPEITKFSVNFACLFLINVTCFAWPFACVKVKKGFKLNNVKNYCYSYLMNNLIFVSDWRNIEIPLNPLGFGCLCL